MSMLGHIAKREFSNNGSISSTFVSPVQVEKMPPMKTNKRGFGNVLQ